MLSSELFEAEEDEEVAKKSSISLPNSTEPLLSASALGRLTLSNDPAESEESPEVKPEETPALVLRVADKGTLLEVD